MDIRQLLARGYQGVDRFLPFDGILDPMFGAPRMGQPQSRVPTMQGGQPQIPGSDVSIGQGGIMGPGEDMGQQLQMQAPQQPPQSFAPPMRGEAPQRSPVSFGRTAWDTIVGGKSPWESMDAQRARPAQLDAMREEDAFARRVFANDPAGYLAWRANRAETGKALASRQEAYTLAPGSVRGVGGQEVQRAPFAPVNVAPGGASVDPTTGRVLYQAPYKPEVVNTGPGETTSVINPGAPTPSPMLDEQAARGVIGSLFPGAVITSGARTPERNAEVGGARGSYHLAGQALDIVPPPGVSVADFRAKLQAQGVPVTELLDEGDHIHWAFGQPRGGASSQVVATGAPKPAGRLASPQEVAGMFPEGVPPKTRVWIGADGKPEVIGGAGGRPPTDGQINAASLTYAAFGGNDRMNALAEQGIYKPTAQLLISERDGVTRLIMSNDTDRQFVQASKEFLAAILRKDTGAAVTDAEFAQYSDIYIPRPEDSPQVLWRKAQARDTALRRLYGAGRKAYDEEYGPPPQWRVLTDPAGKPGAKKPSAPPRLDRPPSGDYR